MKDITAAIAQMGQDEINQLEQAQQYELHLSDERIRLTSEDVEITSEDIPGWSVAREGNITVALDINITDELKKEGIARDLVNRIQNLRKDMGLEVQDKIRVSVEKTNGLVDAAIQAHKNYICVETQALILDVKEQLQEDAEVLELDDIKVKIKIEV